MFHGELNRPFHGAAEGNTALELGGDILGDELCIHIGVFDFHDIDLDLLTAGEIADFLGEVFYFLATASNDNTWTSSVNCHAHTVPSAFDDNAGNGSLFELFLEGVADFFVSDEVIGKVLARGIPARSPVTCDG